MEEQGKGRNKTKCLLTRSRNPGGKKVFVSACAWESVAVLFGYSNPRSIPTIYYRVAGHALGVHEQNLRLVAVPEFLINLIRDIFSSALRSESQLLIHTPPHR